MRLTIWCKSIANFFHRAEFRQSINLLRGGKTRLFFSPLYFIYFNIRLTGYKTSHPRYDSWQGFSSIYSGIYFGLLHEILNFSSVYHFLYSSKEKFDYIRRFSLLIFLTFTIDDFYEVEKRWTLAIKNESSTQWDACWNL